MKPLSTSQTLDDELSRRSLVRKAAYTAPAVFVIAAAPHTALGASGPRRKDKPRKPTKPNTPNKPKNNHEPKDNKPPTTTNRTVEQETKVVRVVEQQETIRVTGAVAGHNDPGVPMVTQLPSTGSGNDASNPEVLIAAASLSVLSAATAITLRKQSESESS